MDNAVARYRAASETRDFDDLAGTLTPDAELVSPLSARATFRGREDLRVLLSAIYTTLRNVRWHDEIGDGNRRVVLGDARIGALKLHDAMLVELSDDGRIKRITPHLRPWLATTLLALRLTPALARHPAVIKRALLRP